MADKNHSPSSPSPPPPPTSSVTPAEPADFKLENLGQFFSNCLEADGTLNMDNYILGYEEVFKFLNLLGTVFSWVASDVQAKLDVLRALRKGPRAEKYDSIQQMLDFEVKEGLINPKARESSSGSRNLLRLHRALHYINTFLEALPQMSHTDKCCPVSQHAYKGTLARHHPWVVQKAALMAMHMLPTKEGLIQKICGESEDEYQRAQKTLPEAVRAMQAVYDKAEQVYAAQNLLDLP